MTYKQTSHCLVTLLVCFILVACNTMTVRPDARYEFDEGLSLFNKGYYKTAIPSFENAAKLDPNYAEPFLYLGRSYSYMHQWDRAIPPLRRALGLSSEKVLDEVYDLYLTALMEAALTESRKQNHRATINYLDEALTLKPQSAEIQNELSRSYLAFGQYLLKKERVDEALEAFDSARKLSPENPAIFMGLARGFLIKGDTLQAIRAVQKTLNLDPENKGALLLFRSMTRK